MATPSKQPINPIIQRIVADGIFGGGMPQQNLSTESKLNLAQQGTFDAFRGAVAPSPTIQQQNEMANSGVYQGGTFGAMNAQGNGLPTQTVGFGGPNVSTVGPEFSGGAINQAFNAFSGGLPSAPVAAAASPVAAPSLGQSSNVFGVGLPPAVQTALSVDTNRQMFDDARQQKFLSQFQVTPGMAPEMAASRFGSQDMLALKQAGIAPSASVNPAFRGVDAAGNPTLTNRVANGSTSLGQPMGAAPTSTAYDQNRQAVAGVANQGRQQLKQAMIAEQLRSGVLKGLEPGTMIDPKDPSRIMPIPGSMAELKYKQAQQEMGLKEKEAAGNEARAAKGLAQSAEKATVVVDTVNRALEKTGLFNQATGFIPFTPGADLNALVDTVKANIGFEELNAMRQASPTGGALGQVAVRELEFLQAALGNLSIKQSPKQLRENLQGVTKHYNNWMKTTQGINPDVVSAAFSPDKQKRLEELRAKMGKK